MSVGFLIIFRQEINLSFIFLIASLLWTILYTFTRFIIKSNKDRNFLKSQVKIWTSQNSIMYFTLYSVITIIFINLGISSTGSDSTQFEGIGRFLANSGTVDDNPPELPFLLNGRLLVLGAMHCLNRLFGAYSLYALNPTIMIWFSGLFFLFLYKEMFDNSVFLKILLITTFSIIMIFYKNFYFLIFSIQNNSLAMIYFSLSIICIYKYLLFVYLYSHI